MVWALDRSRQSRCAAARIRSLDLLLRRAIAWPVFGAGFHFTPTSGSWLNAVENFFSTLTRRRIHRGVFKSILDLQAAINRYLDQHNANPKPFIWTKPANAIITKLQRQNRYQMLTSFGLRTFRAALKLENASQREEIARLKGWRAGRGCVRAAWRRRPSRSRRTAKAAVLRGHGAAGAGAAAVAGGQRAPLPQPLARLARRIYSWIAHARAQTWRLRRPRRADDLPRWPLRPRFLEQQSEEPPFSQPQQKPIPQWQQQSGFPDCPHAPEKPEPARSQTRRKGRPGPAMLNASARRRCAENYSGFRGLLLPQC